MPTPAKLGIIAGAGELPDRIKNACRATGRDVFVAAINGACDASTVSDVEHAWFDWAAVGNLFKLLREAGCVELVLAGRVVKPDFSRLRLDWQGIKLLPRVLAAVARGDDALLKTLVQVFEEQGFRVVGTDALVKDLVAPPGQLGAVTPSDLDRADIAQGAEAARALGRDDRGQAAIVRGGIVLGLESDDGTDALLARVARLEGRGGVLVKMAKPNQERRVDLPTIGLTTIRNAAAARLAGIAVEAGGALILDRPAVVAAADAAGLFLVGIDPGAVNGQP